MPTPLTPRPDAAAPAVRQPSAVRNPSLLRVVGHALWIGPAVTAVLLMVPLLVAAAADHDHEFDSVASQLYLVAVVLVAGLPVSLACSAAAGLVAGVVAWPLRVARVRLGVQAVLGGLGSVVVVGTALTLLWDLVRSTGVFAGLVALACLGTGGLAVLVSGRAAGPPAPSDVGEVRRRRTARWVATASAVALTGALVGVGLWWFHQAADVADSSYADPEPGPASAPRLPTAPPPPTAAPEPPPTALARAELDALRAQAIAAGGDDLPWQAPLTVAEAACTTDTGTRGTALTLTGRFSTRDLATATDNVDFLLITQDNEKVAARIVDAWTDGDEERADVMKGEYWLVPVGTTTVEEAHVGFDQGVGEVRVTSRCSAG